MRLRLLILLTVAVAAVQTAFARRQITPVQPGTPPPVVSATPRQPDMSKLAHFQDENGNVVLVDTVTGTEYPDTLLPAPPKMVYPLVHSLTVGVNIWDAAMRAFGQKFGIGDASVAIGFHNRYFPTVEAGVSTANDTPSGLNFTYRSPLAPYFKIGADYNFFYNSNAAYRLMAGVRYGITSFRYSYTDIALDEGYWQRPFMFDIPTQTSTTGYLEIMLSIRVRIAGPLLMGWAFKYHTILHSSAAAYGDPMVVPGYGKRAGAITGAFSIFYSFTLGDKR